MYFVSSKVETLERFYTLHLRWDQDFYIGPYTRYIYKKYILCVVL